MSCRLTHKHLTAVSFVQFSLPGISGGMALQRTYVSWLQCFICWFIKTIPFRLGFDGGQGRRENMVILEAMPQIAPFENYLDTKICLE